MGVQELVIVVVAALLTSIVGGVAGYGTGLLMPLVLAPIIGAQAVVPILAVSAIFNNLSRIFAFRRDISWTHVWPLTIVAAPFTYLGAAFYSDLSGPGAAIVLGVALIALVPARRLFKKSDKQLGKPAIVVAGAIFGFVTGGVPGGGIILISLLGSLGVRGGRIIATDAVISVMVGLVKITTFQAHGQLPLFSWSLAFIIGVAGVPGAFLAKWIADRIGARAQTGIIDVMVVIGGALLAWRGLSAL